MKENRGSLVIEASIALTAFMFLVLFFLSFGQIYRAQEVIAHGAFQTSQTLAVESFTRENVGESGTLKSITKVADFYKLISGRTVAAGLLDKYRSLGSVSNLIGIIKEEFAYSIAETSEEADKKLKQLGVKDGLNGLNFRESKISDSEICVNVTYELKLQFSFFTKDTIKLSKTSICKAFASIG